MVIRPGLNMSPGLVWLPSVQVAYRCEGNDKFTTSQATFVNTNRSIAITCMVMIKVLQTFD